MKNTNQEVLKLSTSFKEGFNKGYILREYKPELALSLRQTKFPESEKEYGEGIYAGINQKEIELSKDSFQKFSFEKLKEKYQQEITINKVDKDLGKDKE